jgi:long-chain acyl-CoA synthetase
MGSVTFNDPARTGFDPVSVGLPLDGVDIRILHPENGDISHPLPTGSEGQVVVKAPTMLSHVIGESAGQFIDGYALTGDLGRIDQHGALSITGRLRLLIDVGGRKVNPIEVEQVIREHPDVGECVVVPVKVSHTVSRLKAVVIPKGKGSDEVAEAIRSFARERLSAYKVPRMVEFRDNLPRTPLGKILRHLVEAQ